MKPLHHHVERLALRMLQAEQATSPEAAMHALHKAEKHQRKIGKLRRLVAPLERLLRGQ